MSITPKPWKQIGGSAMYNDVFGTARTQDAPPGWESWTPVCRVRKHQDGEANTQAIIAIPDLLEAAEEVCDRLGAAEWGSDEHGAILLQEIIKTCYPSLRAAIDKAKGPSTHTGS